ncbi:MAG: endonuclease domain-containing protein, partial [Actinomycetota bacterium]|nr:endonuclease domain-containing protein [Actinomycetota bacterium]
LWRAQRVVVEVDSWQFHGDRKAFEDDRRRDADLQAAGHRVLRITARQLRREPLYVAARLGALLAR